jgi:hypothetical protein
MYLNASMMMLDSGRILGITTIATDIVNANSIKPKDGSVAMVRFPGTWVIMSESSVQSKSLRRTQRFRQGICVSALPRSRSFWDVGRGTRGVRHEFSEMHELVGASNVIGVPAKCAPTLRLACLLRTKK